MPPPIDPLTGPAFALEGHVVTMDATFTALPKGVVYIDRGSIVAVRPTGADPPDGFGDAPVVRTGGTIYPGLIELHNHLSYNALPMWDVPKRFTNRDQWSSGSMQETYRRLVSGPMTVLGKLPGLVEAVVRYVEAKCLVAGVTTSQGVALFSNQGISKYYEGIVRNVERTYDEQLRAARTRIADVDAADAERFLERLQDGTVLLLHLSEGTDDAARGHFEALNVDEDRWAITPALAGIHCVALRVGDFEVLAEHGGAAVWSPLSNLLLYGRTSKIHAAKREGVRIGLGSDWSPTGSKNLLGELKVARLTDPEAEVFSDRELVALATRNAAEILGWQAVFGSLEPGKRADLLVVRHRKGDPYQRLLRAEESDVQLVVINGVPRYGSVRLMGEFTFDRPLESRTVGAARRRFYLHHPTGDPIVGALSLADAEDRLRDAMGRLPQLALDLEHPSASLASALLSSAEPHWMLVLEHEEPAGIAQRPHLPGPDGLPTARLTVDLAAAAKPLSELLEPLELDALTVSDDDGFLEAIAGQRNLPQDVARGLPGLY